MSHKNKNKISKLFYSKLVNNLKKSLKKLEIARMNHANIIRNYL